LQVGVQLSPDKKMYLNGEQVLPAFYYRNVGVQLLDTSEVNLTRDRFYDKLVAIDAAGQEIPIEQDRKPGNPVWEPKSLRPGAMYELLGLPLLLGKGERNPSTGEAAIRVLPGASVRLHFVLRSPVKGDKKSLTTGDIEFAIFASKANAELKEQSERRKSSNPTKDQGASHSIIRSGDQVIVTLKAKKPETFDNTTIYTVDDHGKITLDSRVGSPTIEIAGLDESKAAEAIQKSLKHSDSWKEVRVERGANLP
jgi:hypothetical protein